MAVLHAEVFSESLMRKVPLTCLIPADKCDYANLENEKPTPRPYRTLYLLHGAFGSETDYLMNSRIAAYADQYKVAIIMPAGENHFYLDGRSGVSDFGTFVGSELVEITRRLFPLSEKREDTGIAGLSMGGYGAVVNGLMHPETFGSIGMLSAALIQERVINSTFEEPMPLFNRRYYQEIYKDIDAIKGSELDYQQQISKMAKAGQTIPNFFICCGEEDVACIDDARNYHALLEELGIAHHYHEGPGGHDWNYWDENLAKLLAWFTQTK